MRKEGMTALIDAKLGIKDAEDLYKHEVDMQASEILQKINEVTPINADTVTNTDPYSFLASSYALILGSVEHSGGSVHLEVLDKVFEESGVVSPNGLKPWTVVIGMKHDGILQQNRNGEISLVEED
jgi:hypothetical protein